MDSLRLIAATIGVEFGSSHESLSGNSEFFFVDLFMLFLYIVDCSGQQPSYFEPMIERTVEELKNINPDIVVLTHCTGWKAMNQFSQEMADQFVLNSVGTRIILGR